MAVIQPINTTVNKVETFFAKQWAWLKANVVHIAGYASIVAAIKKLI